MNCKPRNTSALTKEKVKPGFTVLVLTYLLEASPSNKLDVPWLINTVPAEAVDSSTCGTGVNSCAGFQLLP